MAKRIVLAGACRTAIGKMGGGLSATPAVELGALVIKEALQRAGREAGAGGSRLHWASVLQGASRSEPRHVRLR